MTNDGHRGLSVPRKGKEWVDILRKAASSGKKGIMANYDATSRFKVTKIGAGGDHTLRIDEASENAIYDSLVRDLGKDSFIFVSEEVGEKELDTNEPRPIIFCDPLDGSHNAMVGLPLFSISLSVLGLNRQVRPSETRYLGDVDAGYILNVPTGDEFYSVRNEGSFHNGSKIGRRKVDPLRQRSFATIGIECGDVDFLKKIMRGLSTNEVYKLRVLGSAAISYCLLSDETLDGFIFVQPNGARTIDSPAGYLIAKEAGRAFADISGRAKNVEDVKLGFDSRINIAGARDKKALSKLLRMIRK